jgi:hypothetical protein
MAADEPVLLNAAPQLSGHGLGILYRQEGPAVRPDELRDIALKHDR